MQKTISAIRAWSAWVAFFMGGLLLQGELLAQTFTNDVRVYSHSFILTGLSGSGVNIYFSTHDGNGLTWPLGVELSGGYVYGDDITGEVSAASAGSSTYYTDFFVYSSAYRAYIAYGDASIFNVPVSVDVNQDGFPDVLQYDQSGTFNTTGQIQYADLTEGGAIQNRSTTLRFARSKGSGTGSCSMSFVESGSTYTLSGSFITPGFYGKTIVNKTAGTFTSTLTANISPVLKSTISAGLQFPGGNTISLSGLNSVEKSNNVVLGRSYFDDLILTQRISVNFKGYVGRVHQNRDDPLSSFQSLVDSYIVVDCPDTDEDGSLDLTDDTPLGVPSSFTGAGKVVGEAGRAIVPVTVGVSPTCRNFVASGLPPGLAINLTSGVISGTPTTAGIYPFSVTARVKAGLAPATSSFTAQIGGVAQTLPFTDDFSRLVPNRYLFSSTNLPPRMIVANGMLEYRSDNPPQNIAWATPSLLLALTNSWDLQVDARVPTNWPVGEAKVGVNLLKEIPGGTFDDILPNRINLKFGVGAEAGNFFEYHHYVDGAETTRTNLIVTNGGLARLRFLFHGGTRTLTLYGASYNGANLTPWVKLGEESLAPGQGLGQSWGLALTNRLRLALWGQTDNDDGNANGTRRMALDNLSVTLVTPPRITGITNFNGQVGVNFSNRVTATNGQTYFTATNLPAGLTLDEATGIISGIPQVAGRLTNCRVGAGNPAASSETPIAFTILPAFTSASTVTGFVNDLGFTHPVTVGTHNFGANLKFSATGLPTGMTINATSGVISGKPTVAGAFPATVTITALGASASQRIDFTIQGAAGGVFSLTLNPRPTNVLSLPMGLSYSKTTGVISGTPKGWGDFTATGQMSNGTTTSIDIPVMPSVPVIGGPASWIAQVGQGANYRIVAGGYGREWAGWDDFSSGITKWRKTPADMENLDLWPTVSSLAVANGELNYQCKRNDRAYWTYLLWNQDLPLYANWAALAKIKTSGAVTQSSLGSSVRAGFRLAKIEKPASNYIEGILIQSSGLNSAVSYSPKSPSFSSSESRSSGEQAFLAFYHNASDRTFSYHASIPTLGSELQELETYLDSSFGLGSANVVRLGIGGLAEGSLVTSGQITFDDFVLLPDPDDIEYRAYLVNSSGVALTNGQGERYLPDGLECDPQTGSVSGTVSSGVAAGVYQIRTEAEYLTANLPIQGLPTVKGGKTVPLTLLPAFTGASSATGFLNVAGFTHQVAVGTHSFGSNLKFSATGLPTGTTINTTSGLISGKPTVAGTFGTRVTITAGTATAFQDIQISVYNGQGNRWAVGSPVSYQVNLGTGVTGYQASGLPTGMAINASTGLISGTPVFAGSYNISAQARNSVGVLVQSTIQLIVDRAAPLFANAGTPQFRRTNQISYPSIFFAWNLDVADRLTFPNTVVPAVSADKFRHDLGWVWSELELKWNDSMPGQATYLPAAEIVARRKELQGALAVKPSLIHLIELHYRDAPRGSLFLPTNSPFWLRKTDGSIESGWSEGSYGRLDFSHPQFQDLLAARAKSLMDANLGDGILLDWWNENFSWPEGTAPYGRAAGQTELQARKQLLAKIRAAVGEDKLIFGNTNYDILPETGADIDGVFMECFISDPPSFPPPADWNPTPYGTLEWQTMENALQWFSTPGNLRSTGFTCLELWARYGRTDSRDLKTMRAGLAMSLCLSDGCYVFDEPNWWKLPSGRNYVDVDDHRHSWYYQWDKSLGRPLGNPKSNKETGGYYQRQFQNGWVVYNPVSNGSSATLTFSGSLKRISTGQISASHIIDAGDGDLFVLP